MTEISVSLDKNGVNDAIKQLNAYKRKIASNMETAIQLLADMGADTAREMYSNVEETVAPEDDPTNVMTIYADFTQDDKRHIDVFTEAESKADKSVRYVVGNGSGVGFAEFGAGAYSDSNHPFVDRAPFPVYAGSWSEQDQQQYSQYLHWWFSNLIYYGIAPARGLYEAQKKMTAEAANTVQSVFKRGSKP